MSLGEWYSFFLFWKVFISQTNEIMLDMIYVFLSPFSLLVVLEYT